MIGHKPPYFYTWYFRVRQNKSSTASGFLAISGTKIQFVAESGDICARMQSIKPTKLIKKSLRQLDNFGYFLISKFACLKELDKICWGRKCTGSDIKTFEQKGSWCNSSLPGIKPQSILSRSPLPGSLYNWFKASKRESEAVMTITKLSIAFSWLRQKLIRNAFRKLRKVPDIFTFNRDLSALLDYRQRGKH